MDLMPVHVTTTKDTVLHPGRKIHAPYNEGTVNRGNEKTGDLRCNPALSTKEVQFGL